MELVDEGDTAAGEIKGGGESLRLECDVKRSGLNRVFISWRL